MFLRMLFIALLLACTGLQAQDIVKTCTGRGTPNSPLKCVCEDSTTLQDSVTLYYDAVEIKDSTPVPYIQPKVEYYISVREAYEPVVVELDGCWAALRVVNGEMEVKIFNSPGGADYFTISLEVIYGKRRHRVNKTYSARVDNGKVLHTWKIAYKRG